MKLTTEKINEMNIFTAEQLELHRQNERILREKVKEGELNLSILNNELLRINRELVIEEESVAAHRKELKATTNYINKRLESNKMISTDSDELGKLRRDVQIKLKELRL